MIKVIIEAFQTGAGNETRTRDPNLGKVVLYQLSYSRDQAHHFNRIKMLVKQLTEQVSVWRQAADQ